MDGIETHSAEPNSVVAKLAGGIAHALRNPLTSIKLLLQHGASQDGRIQLEGREVRVVLAELSRIEKTIQELMDFACPTTSHRRVHDLREIVQRALNSVTPGAQQALAFSVSLPDYPLFVVGDPDQLYQALVNILGYGLEAMTHGGTFAIGAAQDAKERVVRVEFHDAGARIPDQQLIEVFEPFVSTRGCQSGLGLATSLRTIVQHGGSLVVENHPRGGVALTLTLPISSSRPECSGTMLPQTLSHV